MNKQRALKRVPVSYHRRQSQYNNCYGIVVLFEKTKKKNETTCAASLPPESYIFIHIHGDNVTQNLAVVRDDASGQLRTHRVAFVAVANAPLRSASDGV